MGNEAWFAVQGLGALGTFNYAPILLPESLGYGWRDVVTPMPMRVRPAEQRKLPSNEGIPGGETRPCGVWSRPRWG